MCRSLAPAPLQHSRTRPFMLSPTTSAADSSLAPPLETPEQAPAMPSFRSSLAATLRRFAPPLAFIAVIAAWEFSCWFFAIPTFLLPAPSRIVAGLFEQPWPIWLGHTFATLRVAVMGYVAAIVVSIPLAVALASSPLLSRTLYPMIVVVHSTPIVAVAPIIVVTLGTTDLPRVFITFLITFFPIVVTTTAGLLATPEEMVELSRSLRAGQARAVLHIRLP